MESFKMDFVNTQEAIAKLLLDAVAVQLTHTQMLKAIGEKLGITFDDLSSDVERNRSLLLKLLYENHAKLPPDIEESLNPE